MKEGLIKYISSLVTGAVTLITLGYKWIDSKRLKEKVTELKNEVAKKEEEINRLRSVIENFDRR